LGLKINQSDLAECLKVLRIIVHNVFVVKESITKMVNAILMQDLSQSEMCWDTHRVKFDAMLEVLLGFLHLTSVSKLCGQMDASSKMRLVEQKTLFEARNCLLELLSSLVEASKVELPKGLKFAVHLALNTNFVLLDSKIIISFLVIDPSKTDMGLWNVVVKL
jgi:hypothetical protein